MRITRAAALLMLLAVLLTSCRTSDLAFRKDERLDILAPKDREKVTLPVRVEWTTKPTLRLGAAGGATRFGVFVDKAPMHPGQDLRSLGDDVCKRTPGCPDEAYLRDRYVFLTKKNSIVLDAVPDNRNSTRTGPEDSHDVTIVLLDAAGRRLGEAAYSVQFNVERR